MMSDKVRTEAAETQTLVDELGRARLRDVGEAVPDRRDAPAETAAEIDRRVAEIDMADTQSIVSFGARAQGELQRISQSMLADVRNKDVGLAGDNLREIVTTLRGFSLSELDPNRRRSWWERLLGRAKPVARFMARYEKVQVQIDDITDRLLRHEHQLLKDVARPRPALRQDARLLRRAGALHRRRRGEAAPARRRDDPGGRARHVRRPRATT